MKVKELIRELQKLDGELRVFVSADMMDVCYGEVVGVNFTISEPKAHVALARG